MGKEKPNKERKGLSDEELIEKYESGKFSVKKIMKAMLGTPPEKRTNEKINDNHNNKNAKQKNEKR